MASTAANGARAPRAVLPSIARTAWQAAMPAARSPILSCRSRVRRHSFAGGTRLREGDGAFQQIAVDQGVDDARLDGPRGGDRLALGAHLERERRPAQPRQPLGAPRARNDPEVHLGLTHLRGSDSDAVVARHGELEAAAERVAVNRGNERLAGVFKLFQPRVHRLRPFDGLLARLQLLEDGDVRAGDERRAGANQDDGVGGRIVAGALDGVADGFGHAGAQGIHRWVVDGDDGNAVPYLVPNQR